MDLYGVWFSGICMKFCIETFCISGKTGNRKEIRFPIISNCAMLAPRTTEFAKIRKSEMSKKNLFPGSNTDRIPRSGSRAVGRMRVCIKCPDSFVSLIYLKKSTLPRLDITDGTKKERMSTKNSIDSTLTNVPSVRFFLIT